MLASIEWSSKGEDAGWKRVAALARKESAEELQHPPHSNPIAAKVVAACLIVCGLMMLTLIFVNDQSQGLLAGFAAILFLISGLIYFFTHRSKADLNQENS